MENNTARCPECGEEMKTFWRNDAIIRCTYEKCTKCDYVCSDDFATGFWDWS